MLLEIRSLQSDIFCDVESFMQYASFPLYIKHFLHTWNTTTYCIKQTSVNAALGIRPTVCRFQLNCTRSIKLPHSRGIGEWENFEISHFSDSSNSRSFSFHQTPETASWSLPISEFVNSSLSLRRLNWPLWRRNARTRTWRTNSIQSCRISKPNNPRLEARITPGKYFQLKSRLRDQNCINAESEPFLAKRDSKQQNWQFD